MLKRLDEIEDKFLALEKELGDPECLKDQKHYQAIAKEHAELAPIVETYRELKKVQSEIEENKALLHDADPEISALAKAEIQDLQKKEEELTGKLKILLIPKDPNDEKNVLLEIRAGTGGDEAALFAADLFRMYSRFAERNRWKIEVLSSHPTGIGGFKEIIALISGKGVYSRLKYESGTHRVQRVPETETQGRIHTSACTVAVLPEADEVDVEIDPSELRIDVYRASGAGGQHVNKTESAVRITHLPTGLVVQCQDERSQHKNKAKAMKVLYARLLELRQREQQAKISEQRRSQVGTGDRSQRIRTYNFPQGRVTDHRIGLTLYQLDQVLDGELDPVIEPLITHFQAEALKEGSEDS
ncbi:Peptide chain release factor 1 [Dissulfuribacter thermophilus]|uniref:Peptide chain release factor 1 n=1 Tax=Dissulfuribacter thermophilus TaxID=1156395 RepID=A0A1B9F8T2_9BACT|nr:peptide chain release factor 1 [Dissulfuribacter thermophilus]OCC16181.1 Peptide chain release factor 1 [Dissulfuribacter thermophilus]